MNVKINDTVSITIDHPEDLVQLMTDEDKVDLITSLSCHDAVIDHVAQQIAFGMTEDGSFGSITYSDTPSTPLDKARRLVAENSSDVAKKEIAKLVDLIESQKTLAAKGWDKYHELMKTLHR